MALVGATGSGKTTLTALVPRLYDVTAGRITLDGVDIRDLSLAAAARGRSACAFEDPTLFSASVRENLMLGRPDATRRRGRARRSRVAQADFVHDLPWGLDTRIGEQGLSLSGGQRQRLALARAMIGRPRVLVLDDPLSALDVHTEALVEEALRACCAGRTALVVVHRPSTVALADRVALLDGGRIVAVGTHAELLATVPAYRDLLAPASPPELGEPSSERGVVTDSRTRRRRALDAGAGAPSDRWRGVAAEDVDELPERVGILLRARSRQLLGVAAAAAPAGALSCWSC